MEHLRYTATKKDSKQPDKPLVSYGFILATFILLLGLLVCLFPGKDLVNTLSKQTYISDVDYRYSILILQTMTKVPLSYRQLNNHPNEVIQQFNDNAKDQPWEVLWLQYMILKYVSYQPTLGKATKIQAEQAQAHYLKLFESKPTRFDEDLLLTNDALAIGKPPLALVFYERALAKSPSQNLYFYSRAAQIALWAKQCVKSANYYFSAQEKAISLEDKRYFYILGLKLLFECNEYDKAITAAENHIDGLRNDELTYQLLTELAIQADKPAKAQDFVLKLLQLRDSINSTYPPKIAP